MDSPPVQASSTNIRLRCIVKLGIRRRYRCLIFSLLLIAKSSNTLDRVLRSHFVLCVFVPILGGAAITCKNELEKINAENLQLVASQLREAMAVGADSPEGIFGMDWSRRPGHSDVDWSEFSLEENAGKCSKFDAGKCSKFVVVHGAGVGLFYFGFYALHKIVSYLFPSLWT